MLSILQYEDEDIPPKYVEYWQYAMPVAFNCQPINFILYKRVNQKVKLIFKLHSNRDGE